MEGRKRVTGGAEDSYWRGAGQRTVTGEAEDSYWRGGGQLLEGRRTVTGMTDVPQGHRTTKVSSLYLVTTGGVLSFCHIEGQKSGLQQFL